MSDTRHNGSSNESKERHVKSCPLCKEIRGALQESGVEVTLQAASNAITFNAMNRGKIFPGDSDHELCECCRLTSKFEEMASEYGWATFAIHLERACDAHGVARK